MVPDPPALQQQLAPPVPHTPQVLPGSQRHDASSSSSSYPSFSPTPRVGCEGRRHLLPLLRLDIGDGLRFCVSGLRSGGNNHCRSSRLKLRERDNSFWFGLTRRVITSFADCTVGHLVCLCRNLLTSFCCRWGVV